jgi:hypothetical protein
MLETRNPVTMNAARIMWMVCTGVAGFSMAAQGSGFVTLPPTRSKPRGSCIHALADTTKNADAVPLTTMGSPASMWARGDSRSQA